MPKSPVLWSPQSPGLRSLDTLWSRRSQTPISARPEPVAPGSHFPREGRAAGGTEVLGCGSYSSCLALPGPGTCRPLDPRAPRTTWPRLLGWRPSGIGRPLVTESQPPRLERPDWLPRSGRPSPPGGDRVQPEQHRHDLGPSPACAVSGEHLGGSGTEGSCEGLRGSLWCDPQLVVQAARTLRTRPCPVHRCVFGWGTKEG